MSKLLSSDCFDSFLLEEASIKMSCTMTLDGHLNSDFFPSDVWEDRTIRKYDFATWSEMRSCCRNFIKGKTAPCAFRFILQLKPEYLGSTLSGISGTTIESVGALVLTIRLDSVGIHVVTGIAMKSFVPDKSAEPLWDKTMQHFLTSKGIDYEIE